MISPMGYLKMPRRWWSFLSIWSQAEGVKNTVERLELHYLANRDPHIHYAILSDFKDAASEQLPEDEAVLSWPGPKSSD